jgi:hypothetical protein
MKTLAEADPVLKELVAQLEDVSSRAVSKSKEAKGILQASKTGQVLKNGGENLSLRLENILNSSSSDLAVVKGLGRQLLSTFEKAGLPLSSSSHHTARVIREREGHPRDSQVQDRPQDHFCTHLSSPPSSDRPTQMDSEKSLSQTIEEKLAAMLRTWKSGMGDKANSFLSAQLSQ